VFNFWVVFVFEKSQKKQNKHNNENDSINTEHDKRVVFYIFEKKLNTQYRGYKSG